MANDCHVYSQNLLDDILQSSGRQVIGQESSKLARRKMSTESAIPRRVTTRTPMDEAQRKKRERIKACWRKTEAERIKNEEEERNNREKLAIYRESKFQERCNTILAGVDLVNDVNQLLQLHDENEMKKARERYQEWDKNVYRKINSEIAKMLESKEYDKIRAMRQKEYQNYLDTCSKKERTFLDIVIASDYDPFVPNRNSIRTSTGKLEDPTLRALERLEEENGLLGREVRTERKSHGSKSDLPIPMWHTGKIESTPHGFFERPAPSPGRKNQSKIQMDHFDYPVGKSATDPEFPVGKRTNFTDLKWDPRRRPPLQL